MPHGTSHNGEERVLTKPGVIAQRYPAQATSANCGRTSEPAKVVVIPHSLENCLMAKALTGDFSAEVSSRCGIRGREVRYTLRSTA